MRAGHRVVADTADPAAAVDSAERFGASLVLLDLSIDGGCVPAVRKLVERVPGIAVLVVAPSLDARVLMAVVRAGAEGLVTEAAGADGFARAIDAALNGEAVIPRDGVAALIDELRAQGRRPATADQTEPRVPADVLVPLRRRPAVSAGASPAPAAARALDATS